MKPWLLASKRIMKLLGGSKLAKSATTRGNAIVLVVILVMGLLISFAIFNSLTTRAGNSGSSSLTRSETSSTQSLSKSWSSSSTSGNGYDPITSKGFSVTSSYVVDPSTILSGSFSLAFNFQRSSFFANGYYWSFFVYVNGSTGVNSIVYSTSSNGDLWNKPTIIVQSSSTIGTFSVWQEASFFYLAYSQASSTLYYDFGSITGSTITWSSPQAILSSNGVYDPFIAVDKDGRPWIGYMGTGGSISVIASSSLANQTWSTAIGFPHLFVGGSNYNDQSAIEVLPTNSGMVAIYSNYTNVANCITPYDCYTVRSSFLTADSWNGTAFEPSRYISDGSPDGRFFSAVDEGNIVDIVFESRVSNVQQTYCPCDFRFAEYNSTTNAFAVNQTIITNTNYAMAPSLSADSLTGDLYAFWINGSLILSAAYNSTTSTWSSVYLFSNESNIAADNVLNTSYESGINGQTRIITLEWAVQIGSTVDVRFGYIKGEL
jgi:hypothetical protein